MEESKVKKVLSSSHVIRRVDLQTVILKVNGDGFFLIVMYILLPLFY
jgi:hypothetical protein